MATKSIQERNREKLAALRAKTAADLTALARAKLKKKQFAIPELRKYPIHDESHARAALSMVAAHGTPEQKARVRAAVAKKFPSIQQTAAKEKKASTLLEALQGDDLLFKTAGAAFYGRLKQAAAQDALALLAQHKPEIIGAAAAFALQYAANRRPTKGGPSVMQEAANDLHSKAQALLQRKGKDSFTARSAAASTRALKDMADIFADHPLKGAAPVAVLGASTAKVVTPHLKRLL
jgi:hypothetical protein